jgi:predicted  nucleic acid-binding Zn-ribbon protein
MPRQLSLLTPPDLDLTPEAGRNEPRLWVRRLVIWREPGVPIREIQLRPGLNILWSPDPSDRTGSAHRDNSLGHGSGKTLFCRLLRYCLGEGRFARPELRERIAEAFPEGMVGAEVMVDGVCWSVVRPIGRGRRHFAMTDETLERIADGAVPPTGIEPLLALLEDKILSRHVVDLIQQTKVGDAWLVALAWLARDQECRFNKALEWRSLDSDSDSPVRNMSTAEHLDALRALIGAIDTQEVGLRDTVADLDQRKKKIEKEAEHLAREAERLHSTLAKSLALDPQSLPPGPLALEALRTVARERFAGVLAPGTLDQPAGLDALRSEHQRARDGVIKLENQRSAIAARIPEIKGLIARIAGENPGLSNALTNSREPICPVCEVVIDRALAEGCRLSHKLPDLDRAKRRIDQNRLDLAKEQARLHQDEEDLRRIEREVRAAQEQSDALARRLQPLEAEQNARSRAWYQARRTMDDLDRLGALVADRDQNGADALRLAESIDDERAAVAALRSAQAQRVAEVAERFDGIVRELVGSEAAGRATLDGNGLKLYIDLGGERSTSAIDSLKVIAFDLAILSLGLEGRTPLPAWLIHDSPREADLGLSVYHQLFRLARNLERHGRHPLFQYIVTTTTPPPDDFINVPELCETLGGNAQERLLRRDL